MAGNTYPLGATTFNYIIRNYCLGGAVLGVLYAVLFPLLTGHALTFAVLGVMFATCVLGFAFGGVLALLNLLVLMELSRLLSPSSFWLAWFARFATTISTLFLAYAFTGHFYGPLALPSLAWVPWEIRAVSVLADIIPPLLVAAIHLCFFDPSSLAERVQAWQQHMASLPTKSSLAQQGKLPPNRRVVSGQGTLERKGCEFARMSYFVIIDGTRYIVDKKSWKEMQEESSYYFRFLQGSSRIISYQVMDKPPAPMSSWDIDRRT